MAFPNWWYCVQWKDPSDETKGTLWTYLSDEAFKFSGAPQMEKGISLLLGGRRHRECMRGVKWQAIWDEGTTHTIRSSPQATKPLMASIVLRWRNPPQTLKREGEEAFTVENLEKRTDSFVYLVRLLTFEETASGAAYFKIGKATSIPKRIKQFGPCDLIAHEVHKDSVASLKREKELHQMFSAFRKPDTEIFLLKQVELMQVVDEMSHPKS